MPLAAAERTSLVRTAEAQVRGGYVLCHRSMIHGALLGTPDEGMKEEGVKVEMEERSWSGSDLCRGVWYECSSVGVVRSCAVASASEALAIAV
jgi:hypothetical protein